MKKITSAVALMALAACSPSSEHPVETSEEKTFESAGASTITRAPASAELGAWGIELDARDLDVKPGDNFFRHAGGTWINNFEIPSDRSSYGAFNILRDRVDERVRLLIEELAAGTHPEGSVEQKIADYFNGYMDVEAINARGLAPIQTHLDAIEAIATPEDLRAQFARAGLNGATSPFGAFIGVDRKDPNRHQVSLGVGGLGLPDRDYYLVDNERFNNIRAAYEAHIAEMFTLAGIDGGAQKASAIVELETNIAEHHWPRADRRNRDKTYNPYTVEKLVEDYPGFDWRGFLADVSYNDIADLNVSQPSSLAPLIEVVSTTSLDTWKAYLSYHLLSNHSPMLPEELDTANFNFYGKTLRGQPEQLPRWKRGVQQVGGRGRSLGEALGRIYIDRYFPQTAKDQMDDLVVNLRKALEGRIIALEWMGDETKEQALQKLSTFEPRIGYPDQWKDFSSLEIIKDDPVGNDLRVREFYFKRALARLNEPTNKIEWRFNTPQTVNATYNAAFNQITFPAGILQPPFFDPAADPAVNYGAIGAVIGHEIGHGFDDQGSKSDANGVQRNWWTDEDRARFRRKSDGPCRPV